MNMVKVKKISVQNLDVSDCLDNSEDAVYSSYEVDKGYGSIASVTGRVQKGARISAHVKIAMNVVTVDKIQSLYETHKSRLNESSHHEIEHHLEENNSCSGLWGIFAGFRSHRDRKEWQKESNFKETIQDAEDKKVLRDIYNLVNTNVEVTGVIDIIGLSFIPTEASLYVKVCTIEFEDGKTLQVIDSTPVAFAKDGDATKVQVPESNKLNIKKLN
ncbi:hypothetical protein [Enterobacter bugandensis]